jgi:hypothetical protein
MTNFVDMCIWYIKMHIRWLLHKDVQSGIKLLTFSADLPSCQRFHPVEELFYYFEDLWIITKCKLT